MDGTQAEKALSARSPRGTSAQHSFHHLRFEQPDLERQPDVPSIEHLIDVSSDTLPSGADATLHLVVEVRALADSTTIRYKLGCLFNTQLTCRLNSQRVRRCARIGPRVGA